MNYQVKELKNYCEFGEYRVYVLMAIARKKHNFELANSEEIVYRTVLRNEDHIERKYNDLRGQIEQYDHTFRLYLSVNARDTLDAYLRFREEMNDWTRDIIHGHDASIEKLGKVDSYWMSQLHKPANKADQYFQFDLDDVTELELDRFINVLLEYTDVRLIQETPNGYHVITEPFNHKRLVPPVDYDDLDTDGQLFIEEIDTGDSP